VKILLRAAIWLFLLGCGIALGVLWCTPSGDKFPTKWFKLDFAKHPNGEYAYVISTKARKRGEQLQVEPPRPASLLGQAKFVTAGLRAQSGERPLGYEITVRSNPIDNSSLPSGVTNVEAAVSFKFTLKDRDGFVLDSLWWNQENGTTSAPLLAGQTQTFKGVTSEAVALANASDVASIECEMTYESVGDGRPMSSAEKASALRRVLEEFGSESSEGQ
jgi:hypothetical protein